MKQTLTINWAWVGVYALLTAILGLNLYSLNHKSSERSVSVEGSATIKAEPDSFVFYPQFEVTGSDQAQIKEALAAKSNEVVAKLKALGLKDEEIKLNANQYGDPIPLKEGITIDRQPASTASLTITVGNKALAQKVQDYLETTDAKGQLTPQPTFSTLKREELTGQANIKAVADARQKADALAKNLGAKRGKVLTISNQNDTTLAYPNSSIGIAADSPELRSSLPIQPGTDEFTYHVSVKFALQ